MSSVIFTVGEVPGVTVKSATFADVPAVPPPVTLSTSGPASEAFENDPGLDCFTAVPASRTLVARASRVMCATSFAEIWYTTTLDGVLFTVSVSKLRPLLSGVV